MESDRQEVAPKRSRFTVTILCIVVAAAIVLFGVFVVWPWYINRLISHDVKERVLAADRVVIVIMRPDAPKGGPSVYPVMGSPFMKQMADAVDFGGLQPDMGPLTGDNWTELEFSESGSPTLTLKVSGDPADIGEYRYPFLVSIEDHITNRKVTVHCSEKIYELAEMIRKLKQDRRGSGARVVPERH